MVSLSGLWKSAIAFVAGALVTAVLGIVLLNHGVRLVAPAGSLSPSTPPQTAQHMADEKPIPRLQLFAVSFGRYGRSETAEARARLVRSKGYLASVAPVGTRFLVVSRPYENAPRARQWCRIFSEIGLSGRLVAWGATAQAQ